MTYTTVKELYAAPADFSGKHIQVAGWARTVRDSKVFGFLELNDGSAFRSLQIVFEQDKLENFEEITHLGAGSSVIAEGTLVLTPEAKQPFELKATAMRVEGASTPDYPLQKKRHGFEFLRTIPQLRPRTNTFQAVFRVRSLVAFAIHQFFQQNGFVYVHTPIITGLDCEGVGEMFQLTTLDINNPPRTESGEVDFSQDFFGHKVNVTGSGQLMGESFALAFRNIYTFGPTFRSEASFTPRHAAEFWMIEPEMAFCDLDGNMEIAEAMVKYIIQYVLDNAPDELAFFNQFVDKGLLERLENVVSSDFRRIPYTEAIEILQKSGKEFGFPVEWGCDLATEHERYLTEEVFGAPIFVTNYPKDIKSFYMRLNDDGKTVAAMDLLVPGVGEIIGGSQREDRPELLEQRMRDGKMNMEEYNWYLDLRRSGGAYHSGYGLGFERMVMYVTGISNIRDVIPFPRTTGSAIM